MAGNRERDNIRALISAYLDGELPPEQALYVERMIHEDSRFARTFASYRAIRKEVRGLSRPDAPPAVSAAVRAYTAANPVVRSVLSLRDKIARAATAIVATAALLVAALTGGFGLAPRPGIGPYPANATAVAPATIAVVSRGQTFAAVVNANLTPDDPVEIRFSSAMDEATVLDGVSFTPGVPKQNLFYDANTFILRTTPNTLRADTQYQVNILKGLKDRGGNDVRAETLDFSVGPAPVIASPPAVTPTPQATVIAAAVPTEEPEATATIAATSAAVPTVVAVPATPTPTTAPRAVVTATTAPRAVATTTVAPAALAPTPTPDDEPVAPVVTVARPVVTATVAPRPATATTVRATVAMAPPAPTATTAPRPMPTPTTAPVATPTAAATAVPTAVPTATLVPTPAATATPVPPAIPVSGRFMGAYGQTANRLGDPTGVATNVSGGTSLTFEKGVMVYVPGRSFYVIYPNGAWTSVPNPGGGGRATPQAGGGYAPGGSFGAAWTANNLRGSLGYATAQQESSYPGTIQTFERGVILAVGGDVYVLINGGTYQLFGG